MKGKRLIVCLMAAMLVIMSALPAFAAETEVFITVEATTVDVTVPGGGSGDGSDTDTDGDGIVDKEDDDIDGDGIPNEEDDDANGNGIEDKYEADTYAGGIPIVFLADGSNLYPTNWKIENNSKIADLTLESVSMNAGNSGWRLLPADADTTALAADTKEILFSMGEQGEALVAVVPTGTTAASSGSADLNIVIPANGAVTFDFDVERAAFTEAAEAAKAFDVTLVFNF